jgi:hypothetical protein
LHLNAHWPGASESKGALSWQKDGGKKMSFPLFSVLSSCLHVFAIHDFAMTAGCASAGEPNQPRQATPGSALREFLAHVPGAPELSH